MYPIYCINLTTRIDRKQHSKEQFLKLNIPLESVKFPPFEKDLSGGAYGCFRSHISIWRDFLLNYPNMPYSLIFEDDFLINTDPKECMQVLKDATDFLTSNSVDILHLHDIYIPYKKDTQQFQRGYGCMAHAYFVTRSYLERVFQKGIPQADGNQIDYNMSFNKKSPIYSQNMYFSKKLFFSQYINKSDNYVSIVDSFLRIDHIGPVTTCLSLLHTLKSFNILTDSDIHYLIYCINDIFFIPPSKEKTRRIVNDCVDICKETNMPDSLIGNLLLIFHLSFLQLLLFTILVSKVDIYFLVCLAIWLLIMFLNYYFHGCIFTRIEREFLGYEWKGDTEFFLNKVLGLNLPNESIYTSVASTMFLVSFIGFLRIML